jgi:hypothetical protein
MLMYVPNVYDGNDRRPTRAADNCDEAFLLQVVQTSRGREPSKPELRPILNHKFECACSFPTGEQPKDGPDLE